MACKTASVISLCLSYWQTFASRTIHNLLVSQKKYFLSCLMYAVHATLETCFQNELYFYSIFYLLLVWYKLDFFLLLFASFQKSINSVLWIALSPFMRDTCLLQAGVWKMSSWFTFTVIHRLQGLSSMSEIGYKAIIKMRQGSTELHKNIVLLLAKKISLSCLLTELQCAIRLLPLENIFIFYYPH